MKIYNNNNGIIQL